MVLSRHIYLDQERVDGHLLTKTLEIVTDSFKDTKNYKLNNLLDLKKERYNKIINYDKDILDGDIYMSNLFTLENLQKEKTTALGYFQIPEYTREKFHKKDFLYGFLYFKEIPKIIVEEGLVNTYFISTTKKIKNNSLDLRSSGVYYNFEKIFDSAYQYNKDNSNKYEFLADLLINELR